MQSQSPQDNNQDDLPWHTISWWLMLATAVIAIPALAFAIVTVSGVKGIVALVVFMVACWGCTYFGMHLMHHPSMSEKRDLTKPE
jgi:cytochrome bd-type quinol oxidase subunit 2